MANQNKADSQGFGLIIGADGCFGDLGCTEFEALWSVIVVRATAGVEALVFCVMRHVRASHRGNRHHASRVMMVSS